MHRRCRTRNELEPEKLGRDQGDLWGGGGDDDDGVRFLMMS
jgi:hypothetical protein